MPSKKKIDELKNMLDNDITFFHYFNMIKLIAINRYEWGGLPDSVDPRFLELGLFENGKMLYFEDEVLGEISLQMSGDGIDNIYREPTSRVAYSSGCGGYQKECTAENSVIIYDNYLRTSVFYDCLFFAKRLTDITRTIDINLHVQKMPFVILCDETQKMTVENVLNSIEDNKYKIYGYKGLDIEGIKVLKTDAPFISDKLSIEKMKIWNECLTFLGINNANTEKRERLIQAEANSNTESIDFMMQVGINARKQAIDKINKMFNRSISVKPSSAVAQMYRIAQYDSMITGGVADG